MKCAAFMPFWYTYTRNKKNGIDSGIKVQGANKSAHHHRIIIACATSFIIYHPTFALFILFHLFFFFLLRSAIRLMHVRFCDLRVLFLTKRMVLRHVKQTVTCTFSSVQTRIIFTKNGDLLIIFILMSRKQAFSMKFTSENGKIMLHRYKFYRNGKGYQRAMVIGFELCYNRKMNVTERDETHAWKIENSAQNIRIANDYGSLL